MTPILKVLVGSRAYGLSDETSDTDYRGVFITPTSELLKIQPSSLLPNRVELEADDVNYEVGHFLNLALKSNPSILEIFVAPIVGDLGVEGAKLRGLFPYVWSSKGVYEAFTGYAQSQQKRLLNEPDYNRQWKFAVAYARVLLQAEYLLNSDSLVLVPTYALNALGEIRNGEWSVGQVINWVDELKRRVQIAYVHHPDKQSDPAKFNEFLLQLRKNNW